MKDHVEVSGTAVEDEQARTHANTHARTNMSTQKLSLSFTHTKNTKHAHTHTRQQTKHTHKPQQKGIQDKNVHYEMGNPSLPALCLQWGQPLLAPREEPSPHRPHSANGAGKKPEPSVLARSGTGFSRCVDGIERKGGKHQCLAPNEKQKERLKIDPTKLSEFVPESVRIMWRKPTKKAEKRCEASQISGEPSSMTRRSCVCVCVCACER